MITLAHGKHRTSTHYANSTLSRVEVTAGDRALRLMQSPSIEATCRYLYYFDLFIRKNTFNTGYPTYDTEIRKALGTDNENHLVQAVLAVGALEASKSNAMRPAEASIHRSDIHHGLMSYSSSVTALRDVMKYAGVPSRIQVLWTTLLLGLFEVSGMITSLMIYMISFACLLKCYYLTLYSLCKIRQGPAG